MGVEDVAKAWENHENPSKGYERLIDSTVLGWPQHHGHTPAKMFHSVHDVQNPRNNWSSELRGLSWPRLCFAESPPSPAEKDDAVQPFKAKTLGAGSWNYIAL